VRRPLLLCRACSTSWRGKSLAQPDGGEGLAGAPSNPEQKRLEPRVATQVFPRPPGWTSFVTRRLYGDITGVGDGFTILQTSPEAKCRETSAAQRSFGLLS
jgi:hypothetical protein